MKKKIEQIIKYLHEKRGFDFSGYRPSMVERRIRSRLSATNSEDFRQYLSYVEKYPEELDSLIGSLTINVSRFFRDTLAFEYIEHCVLPEMVSEKMQLPDRSLRVWSAGCSTGEEAYSVAILINELFQKENVRFQVHFFATDIDQGAIQKAEEALYSFDKVKDIKYELVKRYFTTNERSYTLSSEIKELVTLSAYDLLDEKSYVPPDSVFGDFDMVICRNVLIYFQIEYQTKIFERLYRSLAANGYLVLGEAEVPTGKYQRYFRKVNDCCHIYRKN